MGLPNYSTMCRVSERRMVKTLAQLKQEQHDSSELVDLHNEELSLFIIDNRRNARGVLLDGRLGQRQRHAGGLDKFV